MPPKYLLEELRRYSDLITKKAHITPESFERILSLIKKYVTFIEYDSYTEFVDIALKITLDSKDVDFVALALKMNAVLWSNDKALKSSPTSEF